MRTDSAVHAAAVDALLERSRTGGAVLPVEQAALLEQAMGVMWRRAESTLGVVTLNAILDRVLYTTAERYPLVASIKLDGSGLRFDRFKARADDDLSELIRALMVEFLSVLGHLTAEILTPALHAQLAALPATPSPVASAAGSDGGNHEDP